MMYFILFVISAVLVALYTFFEMAYLLTSKTKLKKTGRLYDFLKRPERVIITVLIGTNLWAISASMFFRRFMGSSGGEKILEGGLIVTLILFIFSEMLPKNIATYLHERFFNALSPFIWFTYSLFSPIIIVIEKITRRFYRNDSEVKMDRERDVMSYISELRKQFPDKAMEAYVDVVEETVRFLSAQVVDYSMYLGQINFIDLDNPDLKAAKNYDFSVVYKGNIDNVVGILKAKYIYLIEKGYMSLEEALYEPVFVHESQSVRNVLARLSESGRKESIVVDEHGNIKGVFSVCSLRSVILNISRGHFITVWGEDKLERLARLCGEVNTYNVSLTVHEFLMSRFGNKLRPGSSMTIGSCKITVLSMKGGIIGRIIVDTRGGDDGTEF